MSLYAINDTTLTTIGDAVRSKVIGISGLPTLTTSFEMYYRTDDGPHNSRSFHFENVSKIKAIINITWGDDGRQNMPIWVAPGVFVGDLEQRPNGCIILPRDEAEFPYEVIIEGTDIGFGVNQGSGFNKAYIEVELMGLDENGDEFKYTPLEMADAINGINTNPTFLLPKIISKAGLPYFGINKEDFGDITKIGTYALYRVSGLNSIELPDTLQEIEEAGCNAIAINEITFPASFKKLGSTCFANNSLLTTVRILNDTSVITCPSSSVYNDPFYNCSKLASIYIPSKLYNAYCSDDYWGQHEAKFIPVGEWAFDPMINSVLLFNQTKEVSIQLTSFANTPEFSITSSNEEVATISNVSINEDNTLITYTINSFAVEGSSTITVNIIGENNTFNFINNARVFETIPEPTYEVVAVDGATYGFALREDGYWESQNFKKGPSGAVCQVNISNPLNMPVYFDCINYAEANYDYGLLGAVNQVLTATGNDDSGVKKNFKGLSKADIQTVEYLDASGDCFIQVKFRKDSSGDQNNDSIRFKVRFSE